MAAQIHSLLVILISILINPLSAYSQETGEITYGSAEIIRIHQITSDFTLVCDISNYPPVIGQKMPVRIRGLESLGPDPDSELHDFLKTLFTQNQNDPNHPIELRNIQRGQMFCLVADITIDGIDLGDRLVREGLVQRILKISNSQPGAGIPSSTITPQPSGILSIPQPQLRPVPPSQPQQRGFVASKSSKIFHRPDCPHAKRIAENKKIHFSTRDQAIATGRRPCKACNP